jgi:ankyrin repeat protein
MPFESNELFKYTGLSDFKGDLPSIILTEEAKDFFARSQVKGMTDAKGMVTDKGQGLVGIGWVGKNEKMEEVVYVDLLPAFNKDDGRAWEDKTGKKYKEHEHAFTNERLGGNSGRNHEKLLTVITARIQSAYDSKKMDELAKYKDMYAVVENKIIIDKTKLFGFGVFKGDQNILLHSVRNKSANLNPHSIEYNPEFILINYFIDNINDSFQNEYYIKRTLPLATSEKIQEALINQLPLEEKHTYRAAFSKISIEKEASKWQKIKDDPAMKNTLLLESLAKFCDMKSSKLDKIKEIIQFMQKNIAISLSDLSEKKIMLSKLLNTSSEYNSKTVIQNAISNKHSEIITYFIPFLAKESIEDILCFAIKNNDIGTVQLLEENLQNSYKVQDSLLEAAKQGHIDMVDFLKKKSVSMDMKNSEGLGLSSCLSLGLIALAKKEDYYAFKKIISEYKDIDLNTSNQQGETIESVLFEILDKNIKKENINKLIRFKEELPDFFEKVIQVKNEKEEKNGLQYSAIYTAVTEGNLKILDFLLDQHIIKFDMTDTTNLRDECLKCHLVRLIKKSSYDDVMEILNKNNIKLDSITVSGDKIYSILFDKFQEEIIDGNLLKLKEFKNTLPELYNGFLETPNSNGDTALIMAVSNNHANVVNYLLDEKTIKKEKRNIDNLTPLLYAASQGNLNIIELLLKHGADEKVVNYNKNFIDYLNLGIIELAKNNKFDQILEIKNKYPDLDFTKTNNETESVESIIIKNNPFPSIETLMKIRNVPTIFSKFINENLWFNQSQLELVISNNEDTEKLKFLIDNKADLSIKNSKDESLLLMAANCGNTKAVDILLRTGLFDINQKSHSGLSVLDSLYNNSLYSIGKLLEFEKSFPTLFNVDQAILILTSLSYVESPALIFKYLLEKKPNLEIVNDNGETPLLVAAKNGNFVLVDLLNEQKVNQNMVSKDGAKYSDCLALGVITKKDVDLNKLKEIKDTFPEVDFSRKNDKGMSVKSEIFNLFYGSVLSNNLEELKNLKISFPDVFVDLVNMRNSMESTALIDYLSNPNPNMQLVQFLLESKPDLSIEDEFGNSAISQAMAGDCFEGLKLLRQAGALKDITSDLFNKVKLYITQEKYEKLNEFKEHLPDVFNKMLVPAAQSNDFYILSSLLKNGASLPNEDKSIVENINKCIQLMEFEEKDIRSKRSSVLNALYKTPQEDFKETLAQFTQLDNFIKKLNTIGVPSLHEATQVAYEKCAENPKQVNDIMGDLIKKGQEICKSMTHFSDSRLFGNSKNLHTKNNLIRVLDEANSVMKTVLTYSSEDNRPQKNYK